MRWGLLQWRSRLRSCERRYPGGYSRPLQRQLAASSFLQPHRESQPDLCPSDHLHPQIGEARATASTGQGYRQLLPPWAMHLVRQQALLPVAPYLRAVDHQLQCLAVEISRIRLPLADFHQALHRSNHSTPTMGTGGLRPGARRSCREDFAQRPRHCQQHELGSILLESSLHGIFTRPGRYIHYLLMCAFASPHGRHVKGPPHGRHVKIKQFAHCDWTF